MQGLIKRALGYAGIYYAKRQYMNVGIDWLWDVHRVASGRNLDIICDVGANVGQTAAEMKARFPAAAVHAFEPIAVTFETLQQNTRRLSGVTCHRLALSDAPGRAAMTAEANSPLNSLVSASERALPARADLEEVAVETIDRFCRDRQIERIGLLKVDAEGADLKALQGADAMLRAGQVAFVFVEVGFNRSNPRFVHVSTMLEYMAAVGLEPYSFYDYCRLQPPSYDSEGLGLEFGNALFVSPAAISRLL